MDDDICRLLVSLNDRVDAWVLRFDAIDRQLKSMSQAARTAREETRTGDAHGYAELEARGS